MLKRGREAHALLWHAANGDQNAYEQLEVKLNALGDHAERLKLSQLQQEIVRSRPPVYKIPKIAHDNRWSDKFWAERIPDPIPISERPAPLERLPGRRRVPKFVAANGFPFLRYKAGPQSPRLSRVLRQLLLKEQKRWTMIRKLENDAHLAKFEDDWDADDTNDGSWTGAIEYGKHQLKAAINRVAARKVTRSEEMYKIVRAESILAEQERIPRQQAYAAQTETAAQSDRASPPPAGSSEKRPRSIASKIGRGREMGKQLGVWKDDQ